MIEGCEKGTFNSEGFLSDLFNGVTFFVEGGSWDPEAWRAEEGFRRKWEVLFEA